MSQEHLVQLHVNVASEQSAGDSLGWTQVTVDAIEQVGAELSAEGVPTSIQRDSASAPGARGFGIDDVLVGLAINAVSTFFFRIVDDLQHRLARHRDMPQAIVLEAAGRRLQVPANVPVAAVANQIIEWAQSIADTHDVTITLVK